MARGNSACEMVCPSRSPAVKIIVFSDVTAFPSTFTLTNVISAGIPWAIPRAKLKIKINNFFIY